MLSDYRDPINIVHRYTTNNCSILEKPSVVDDPSLDAWRGAAKLANDKFTEKGYHKYLISREEYNECGNHYLSALKEH